MKLTEAEDYDKSSRSFIGLGHIRATTVFTMRRKRAILSKSLKNNLSTDCSLKFESMKKESLVIADHNAAVNMFLISARIVRHA
jgi:hypothetical protein